MVEFEWSDYEWAASLASCFLASSVGLRVIFDGINRHPGFLPKILDGQTCFLYHHRASSGETCDSHHAG